MKRFSVMVLVMVLGLLFAPNAYADDSCRHGGYAEPDTETLEKLGKGKVIARIERLDGSGTYKCQAMGIVAAPIERVWQVLSDYNRFNRFMPRTPVAFLVQPGYITQVENKPVTNWSEFEDHMEQHITTDCSQNPFYFYNRFDMPWPFKDRCALLKMSRQPGIHSFSWVQIMGNMKVNKGSWKLTPFKGSQFTTLAVYTLYNDPGISLPPFLVRLALKSSLPGTIKAVKQQTLKITLEEKKYAWLKPVDVY